MTKIEGMDWLLLWVFCLMIGSCCMTCNTGEIAKELHEINQKLPQPAVVETENG